LSAKPLIQSQPLSEFGEFPDSPEFNDPAAQDRDQTYVPGFGDLRRKRDEKVAEFNAGRIGRHEVPTLPVNLRWARNQTKAGVPDSAKPFLHGRKGYRAVTKDDVNPEWLTALPPGAQIGADGTIRNGDCVLMVASAQDAAKSERTKRQLVQERLKGVEASFEQHALQAGANMKAQPYVTMEPTTPTEPVKGKKKE